MIFLIWFMLINIWRGDAAGVNRIQFFYSNGTMIPDVSELSNKNAAITYVPYSFWNSGTSPSPNLTVYYKNLYYDNTGAPLFSILSTTNRTVLYLNYRSPIPNGFGSNYIFYKNIFWDYNRVRIYENRWRSITNDGRSVYVPFIQLTPQGQLETTNSMVVYYNQTILSDTNQPVDDTCLVKAIKQQEWPIPYNIYSNYYQIDSVMIINMFQTIFSGIPRVIFDLSTYFNSSTNPVIYIPQAPVDNPRTFYYETILYQFDGTYFNRVSSYQPGATFRTFDDIEMNPNLLNGNIYVYETIFYDLNGMLIRDTTPLKINRYVILKPIILFHFPGIATNTLNYTMIETPRSKGVNLTQNYFELLNVPPQASIELMYGNWVSTTTEMPTPCVYVRPPTARPTTKPPGFVTRKPRPKTVFSYVKKWIQQLFDMNNYLLFRRKVDDGTV